MTSMSSCLLAYRNIGIWRLVIFLGCFCGDTKNIRATEERCMVGYLLVTATDGMASCPFFYLIMVRVLLMGDLLCLLEIT